MSAILEGHYKTAVIKIGPFSFPNKNFAIFQKTILECIPTTDDDFCDDCGRYHKGPCEFDIDGRPLNKETI